MAISRTALAFASPVLPQRINDYLLEKFAKRLKAQLSDKLTDDFLEFLLGAMDVAFILSPDYRENIRDFQATLVFGTADQGVATTAAFKRGKMSVKERAIVPSDVRVTFTDAKALWSFLLSENQDVLDSILQNTVDVEGNLNYLYRFGFLARDLTRRIGIA
jgi:hypothetical protein